MSKVSKILAHRWQWTTPPLFHTYSLSLTHSFASSVPRSRPVFCQLLLSVMRCPHELYQCSIAQVHMYFVCVFAYMFTIVQAYTVYGTTLETAQLSMWHDNAMVIHQPSMHESTIPDFALSQQTGSVSHTYCVGTMVVTHIRRYMIVCTHFTSY